ncbi:hypothetical protein KKC22_09925 [Myxococcota bacterium]|nr:hypothetical protein [Myxococcota bacterium]
MRYFVQCWSFNEVSPCLMHQNGCVLFPDPDTVELLGDFDCAHEALRAARERFGMLHGCHFCCPECATPVRTVAEGRPAPPGAPKADPPP